MEGAWYNPPFSGQSLVDDQLRVRFRFDSESDWENDYFGWIVDDVEIRGCLIPPGCLPSTCTKRMTASTSRQIYPE